MKNTKSEKKRLLILGSGFSKAVSEKMPVVSELADALKTEIKNRKELGDLSDPQYQSLLKDPELLLTYLAQDQPWKETWEAPKEWALFLQVSDWLAKHIKACEDEAFKSEIPPKWAKHLAKWLHETKTSVITFNYDTVLERIVWFCEWEKWGKGLTNRPPDVSFDLYQIPLSSLALRESGKFSSLPKCTFHLIKLHGSINWFYSGSAQWPGEHVYFRSVDSESPNEDMINNTIYQSKVDRWLMDKVPLIIPPVAEKSRFYANRTIRSLWGKAREYLAQAEEIYCVGYSLPDTDLTTKLLLQTACAGQTKIVYIVNNDVQGKENLLRRYRDAFPQGVMKKDYLREDAVEAMVNNLCKEEVRC
jgi:hypothetical protein